MRPVQLKRRGVAAMVAVVALVSSASLAGLGTATAAVPADGSSGAGIQAVKDEALVAEPASTPTTLSRGASTVTVSRSANLTRQMLTVSWTGMEASGFAGSVRTRPVVVMQCRGANPDRSDCWIQESASIKPSFYQPAEPTGWFTSQSTLLGPGLEIPFRRADGEYHATKLASGNWAVPSLTLPAGPLPPVDDWTPATSNTRFGLTQADGTGQVQTWVNTSFENTSLGCSDTEPCSLVVIPVHAQPCRTDADLPQTQKTVCATHTTSGENAKAQYWQLLANWYERYVFKLGFAPRATVCGQRDDTAELTGSELVAEAMRRWVPARCQTSSPVALDYTRKWEPESRTLLGTSDPIAPSGYGADGALTSEPAEPDGAVASQRKPGYAPVAVSGLSIGYFWEYQTGPNKGKPVPDVKLTPRLVAKMLTQSYPGQYRVDRFGRPVNPNAPTNPSNILNDPEFQQLNPDTAQWAGFSDGTGTQMAIPGANTDVLLALTRWIWADPSARAFMQGKADQWGMTVNKTYRNWPLPRDAYDLRDGWVLPAEQGVWTGFSPQQLGAATTNSWAEGTDSLMTAWPLSQVPTITLPDPAPRPKRGPAQDEGRRNVIALSTTSELEKLGMRTALLQNSAGEFVGPNVESMTFALDGAAVDKASGTWKIDYATMDKRGYPGTMITYAEVPTATLKGDAPRQYAETLRWITTEGQTYGVEMGQLPDGYLALTEPMREQAAKVADAVESQSGTPPIPDSDPLPDDKDPTPTDAPPTAGQNGPVPTSSPAQNGNLPTPTASTPRGTPSTNIDPAKKQPQAVGSIKPVSATTQGDSLGWLAWGIPALLVAGLAAGVASPGIRLIAQPGHPVRRGIVAGGTYVVGLLRRGRRRSG